jgi:hypothetical protein
MVKLVGYGTLAVSTLVLGFWGLAIYLHGRYGLWDIAYYDLQLFVLSSEPIRDGGKLPAPLQIARFAAPAVTAYAIISAVVSVLDARRRELRIQRSTNHVVVCGGGRKGVLLATRLREEGAKVVLVDVAPNMDTASACKDNGIMLVDGEPNSLGTLRRAAVRRAVTLYVVTPNSATNVAIVVLAHKLTLGRTEPLRCYVFIEDRGLRAALMAHYLGSPVRTRLELDLFSEAEISAHVLLDRQSPVAAAEVRQRIAIIGLDGFGQALVLELARRWQGRFRLTGEPLQLTLVDENAVDIWAQLTAQYRVLAETCQVDPIAISPGLLQTSAAGGPLEPAWRTPPDSIFVSTGDTDTSLAIGLWILRISPGTGTRVTICVDAHGQELNEIFHNLTSRTFGDFASFLSVFGTTEAVSDPHIIREGIVVEQIARSLHGRYLDACLAQGDRPSQNEALRTWDELPERFRESNRSQARHIGWKINSIGCFLVPYIEGGTPFSFRSSPDEIEQLARAEHVRWMEERLSTKYKYSVNGNKNLHPDLVDWYQLPEPAREKDRIFVRAIPDILADTGFQIMRNSNR